MSLVGVPCIVVGDWGYLGEHGIPIGTTVVPHELHNAPWYTTTIYRVAAVSTRKGEMPVGGWYVPIQDLKPVNEKEGYEDLV